MAKLTRPIIRIHNIETDEVIDREMNDDEFAQYEADKATQLAKQAEADTKAAEKQALLDKLGITADEAKLLLG
jgi:signal-transduction protein with cAMP-binding, CBS, and nucleotidyltransferase domain